MCKVVGKQDIDEWAMGGWSRAYEGGRYLGCCWNLVPPTDNYRAVSLLFTTAVAAYLWIGLDSTHKSPHTHVGTQARVLSLPQDGIKSFLSRVWSRNFTLLYFDHMSSSVIGLRRQCKQC